MLQLILPTLIFLSLGVIIFFAAKHYPQLKEGNGEKTAEINQKNKAIRKNICRFFLGVVSAIRDFSVLVAEKIIKKTKELLHLAHFWIIKIKKKKDKKKTDPNKRDEFLDEIEAKEELIKQEEEGLEKVIHSDLGSSEQDDLVEKAKKKIKETDYNGNKPKEDLNIDGDVVDEKIKENGKIQGDKYIKANDKNIILDSEISEEEIIVESKKASINADLQNKFGKFFKKHKEKEGEDNYEKNDFRETDAAEGIGTLETEDGLINEIGDKARKNKAKTEKVRKILDVPMNILGKLLFWKKRRVDTEEDENYLVESYEEENFSDGIVKIEEYEKSPIEENLLIKEVVKKDKDEDLDEEIGVDRQILEKKLINKVVQNPRQVENYRQLGELYIKMENFLEASECYRQILRIRARDVDAKRKLEKIKLLKRIKK